MGCGGETLESTGQDLGHMPTDTKGQELEHS